MRYLCQDETRLGLKSETGKVITAFGVKPVVQVQWQRDNFWLYGVVEPLSGWHFTQEYSHFNTEHLHPFIDALSEQLGEKIAVIQQVPSRSAYDFSPPLGRELDSHLSTGS